MTSPPTDAFWMPFTPNRQFKAVPRMVASAQGITCRTVDGREVLDGAFGLWCAEAMKRQIDTLDHSSSFQVGHPVAFELAERIAELAPSLERAGQHTGAGATLHLQPRRHRAHGGLAACGHRRHGN